MYCRPIPGISVSAVESTHPPSTTAPSSSQESRRSSRSSSKAQQSSQGDKSSGKSSSSRKRKRSQSPEDIVSIPRSVLLKSIEQGKQSLAPLFLAAQVNPGSLGNTLVIPPPPPKPKKGAKNPKLICEVCHKKFKHYDSLKQHLARHGGSGGLQCPECGVTRASKKSLRVHMKQHDESLQEECPKKCGSMFSTKSGLRKHLVEFHSGERVEHKCPFCTLTRQKENDQKLHTLRCYSNPRRLPPFVCRGLDCDREYIMWRDCARHQREKHMIMDKKPIQGQGE